MKKVGIRKFRLKMYSIIKGKFPIVITRRKRPVYIVEKIDTDVIRIRRCEFCNRVRRCTMEGISQRIRKHERVLQVEATIGWVCHSCRAFFKSKGVIV